MITSTSLEWRGNNPLMGPNDDSLGERFVGMAHTYDLDLRQSARQVADELLT